MCVRQADPLRGKSPSFDHVPNILQPHRADGNQLIEIRQCFLPFRQRAERQLRNQEWVNAESVSYTHLDVYKRQHQHLGGMTYYYVRGATNAANDPDIGLANWKVPANVVVSVSDYLANGSA